MPHFIDRAKPGVIAVMRDGKRFANEGNSYHDFVQAMIKAAKPGEEIAAYPGLRSRDAAQIRPRLRAAVPDAARSSPAHRLSHARRRRWRSSPRKAGIDAKALDETVAQFNATAPQGHDPAFGKGSNAYNRYQGDALHGPNPCVAPIENGPFYAIKMVIGDLGTYAGIVTDENARALDAEGGRFQGSTPPATTWRASWAAIIPAPASRSGRR